MSSSTIITGIGQMPTGTPNQGPTSFATPSSNATVINGVNSMPLPPTGVAPKGQLFGFLYSVSKTMAGEYWPLYLGANTIGRGVQNNINLEEGTVSENHASIHIISRRGDLVVYITDSSSKTGTLLNGNLLRGEADLNTGDIITIGENYEMLVMLVNPTAIGLKVNEKFVNVQSPVPPVPPAPTVPPVKPFMGGSSTVVEGQSGAAPVGGHTVIMGGPIK